MDSQWTDNIKNSMLQKIYETHTFDVNELKFSGDTYKRCCSKFDIGTRRSKLNEPLAPAMVM